MADKLKLAAAVLLVAFGIAGFYLLSDSPAVLRVLSVLAGIGLAAAVAYFTAPGRDFYAFSQASVAEARKVVWPTRKETLQMTGVVVLFVIIMAIFLWLTDTVLAWLLQALFRLGKLVFGGGE